MIELTPPDDTRAPDTRDIWIASYQYRIGGRTMRESLEGLRERLTQTIKKIDEVLKDEEETSK